MRRDSPSPSEPVSELRKVKIVECGERLVDFTVECPGLVLVSPVYGYTRATLVRRSVAEKLNRAIEALPEGYGIGIIEGWRPRYVQRRMYNTNWLRFKNLHPDWSDLQLRRVVNRFTHPPEAAAPPPHSSGGAVDVVLIDAEGIRLDHSSPYKPFDPRNYPTGCAGLSDLARRHREILGRALLAAGFTNYPSEYWHWSYGDQGWAYRGGHPHAIYGPILDPEGWTPVAADDVDEPLARLWAAGPGSGYPKPP
jgi:D-alanyl-D-alanine dipeptidase